MLSYVVMIDLFFANQPWDRTLSVIVGKISIGEFTTIICVDAVIVPLIPCIDVLIGVSGRELVFSSQDSLLKTILLAPESKIQISCRCFMAFTLTTLAAPSSGKGSFEFHIW